MLPDTPDTSLKPLAGDVRVCTVGVVDTTQDHLPYLTSLPSSPNTSSHSFGSPTSRTHISYMNTLPDTSEAAFRPLAGDIRDYIVGVVDTDVTVNDNEAQHPYPFPQ